MAHARKLFEHERAPSILMIAAMLAALAAANSPLKPLYDVVHHTPVHFRFGPLIIDRPLVDWINEGLMVFFFLLVGLEMKRQIIEGHLSSIRRAALPAFAAIGGMIAPAAIYATFNMTEADLIRGWPIPSATDIVLALGMLSLLGDRIPEDLKVFLVALAIFDDVAAVVIIGFLYGESISLSQLVLPGLALLGLASLNVMRVARPAAYVVFGLILWVAALKAGVEAALVGVVVALAVPLRLSPSRSPSPLRETEQRLHPWSVLFIVPIFAFFNAGITINGDAFANIFGSVSLGIVLGLFIGKQLGVFVAAWTAVQLRLAELPPGVNWSQLYGAALLAGIGFTMSLFITSLAFSDPLVEDTAKLAILIGSSLSALAGIWWLVVISDWSKRAPMSDSDRPLG